MFKRVLIAFLVVALVILAIALSTDRYVRDYSDGIVKDPYVCGMSRNGRGVELKVCEGVDDRVRLILMTDYHDHEREVHENRPLLTVIPYHDTKSYRVTYNGRLLKLRDGVNTYYYSAETGLVCTSIPLNEIDRLRNREFETSDFSELEVLADTYAIPNINDTPIEYIGD